MVCLVNAGLEALIGVGSVRAKRIWRAQSLFFTGSQLAAPQTVGPELQLDNCVSSNDAVHRCLTSVCPASGQALA